MKEKIAKLLPADKARHFLIGFLIFVIANIFLNEWYSLLIVSVVAVLNEVNDEREKKGAFSIMDIVFTVAPAITLILIYGTV